MGALGHSAGLSTSRPTNKSPASQPGFFYALAGFHIFVRLHLAMQEALDGKAVEWMEHVADEHYGAAVAR